jgi:hypothetical protein
VPLLQLTGSGPSATTLEGQRMIHATVPRSRLRVFECHRGTVHVYRAEDCAAEAMRFWNDVDTGRDIRN